MASGRVPRGMTALAVKDSEEVLDQIAEAYVNMDLRTMTEFQKRALARMAPTMTLEAAILQGMGGGGAAVAAAPVAAKPAEAAGDSSGGEAAPAKKAVEKQAFNVALKKYPPPNKVKLIKELRTVCNLPIQDAKAAIEKCPGIVATNVPKEDAEKLKKAMEALEAEVELQ
ncbi:ribosomal protein L7/L12-like protein [Angomonas deanei]|nr:ribosomal protein L7/L12-like protein [Angomonas deanei]|eukprot:EPY25210.1 ribosomal protein L7/L12-like protein [Angomonas deanei]